MQVNELSPLIFDNLKEFLASHRYTKDLGT